jgi:hypothetical protein
LLDDSPLEIEIRLYDIFLSWSSHLLSKKYRAMIKQLHESPCSFDLFQHHSNFWDNHRHNFATDFFSDAEIIFASLLFQGKVTGDVPYPSLTISSRADGQSSRQVRSSNANKHTLRTRASQIWIEVVEHSARHLYLLRVLSLVPIFAGALAITLLMVTSGPNLVEAVYKAKCDLLASQLQTNLVAALNHHTEFERLLAVPIALGAFNRSCVFDMAKLEQFLISVSALYPNQHSQAYIGFPNGDFLMVRNCNLKKCLGNYSLIQSSVRPESNQSGCFHTYDVGLSLMYQRNLTSVGPCGFDPRTR